MPYQLIDGTVTTPQGFTAAGICCSIKPNNHTKRDLMLLACDVPCSAAGVYTQNLVKSSAVLVTQEHLKNGRAQAVIANSGNANACCPMSHENAQAMCLAAAQATGLSLIHISEPTRPY